MNDDDIKNGIKKTFDEVAQRYEKIDFFKESARNIVEIISSKNPTNILDVASGTGNVALECAVSLSEVRVDAVDISSLMLECAKEKAKELNITNVNFHCTDIEKLQMPQKYDVVICSYAMFFLPNPIDTLKKLFTHLNEDGMLLFTSFCENAFSPSSKILMNILNSYGVQTPPKSWKNLQTIDDINYLCQKANIKNIKIQKKIIRYPIDLQKWWELNNDAGYRGFLLQLSKKEFESTKNRYFEEMNKYLNTSNKVELIADTFYVLLNK